MAVNSAEKRRCISGIIPIFAPGVTPNTSKDSEWRQASGWGYIGIAAGSLTSYISHYKRRRR